MRLFRKSRPVLLAALMALGLAAHAEKAQAADLYVAGGCFWCVEADFEKVRGVSEVVSGYMGGSTANPTYKQVTRGGTGHYEAVKIVYNPSTVSPRQLYDLFFRSIDPTDAGGQFCDRGNSYRSAIFAANGEQKKAAQAAKTAAEADLGRSVVTPIKGAAKFYVAEDNHQNYYKGSKRVVTRFGVVKQSEAYKRYRKGCGRDARVKQIWGSDAAFIN